MLIAPLTTRRPSAPQYGDEVSQAMAAKKKGRLVKKRAPPTERSAIGPPMPTSSRRSRSSTVERFRISGSPSAASTCRGAPTRSVRKRRAHGNPGRGERRFDEAEVMVLSLSPGSGPVVKLFRSSAMATTPFAASSPMPPPAGPFRSTPSSVSPKGSSISRGIATRSPSMRVGPSSSDWSTPFERTFRRRTEHLVAAAGLARSSLGVRPTA